MNEVFEGKHDEETYEYEIAPWHAGSLDTEILSVKVYLRAKGGRIAGGKVHVVYED